MTLKINSLAPDFTAETSEGKLSLHEWLGDSWGVLFSHPKDFTPVCTTELGALAKMKPEFEKRNVKVMGLSVDPVSDHVKWLEDIKDVCGLKPNYPIVADEDLAVAKLYNMLEGDAGTTSMGRTAVDNETDTQQFILPVIMPLILAFYVGFFTVLEDPHGSISIVFSYIPFTSPIVMLMRIPFGVPLWEQLLSLTVLVITFVITVWVAAKIYRVGILMYGKKPSYRDLVKWLKY